MGRELSGGRQWDVTAGRSSWKGRRGTLWNSWAGRSPTSQSSMELCHWAILSMFSSRRFLSLMSRATFFMAFRAASTSLKSLGTGRSVRLGRMARGCCTCTPQESSLELEPAVPPAVCPSWAGIRGACSVAASRTLAGFEAQIMVW